jgi:hypothetical protein
VPKPGCSKQLQRWILRTNTYAVCPPTYKRLEFISLYVRQFRDGALRHPLTQIGAFFPFTTITKVTSADGYFLQRDGKN